MESKCKGDNSIISSYSHLLSGEMIQVSDEIWGYILSFTDRIEYSANYITRKSTVLRYRAVCRTFSEQCLTLLRKISLSGSKFTAAISGASIGNRQNIRSIMSRLLSHPVSITEVELIGRHDFIELESADCEAVAACKKLRSLKISNMKLIANLELIGDSCKELEKLSLDFSDTIQPLKSFPQVKSLDYRFISPTDRHDGRRLSFFAVPARLLSHFKEWANLVDLSGDFVAAGIGKLVSSLPNLATYTELDRCPEKLIGDFASHCSGKPIASTLRTLKFRVRSLGGGDGNGSDSLTLRRICLAFPNLKHLELQESKTTLSDMETVTALSKLINLETLDLNGNNMFFDGDEDRVNEWLQTRLPLFPKSLEVIDLREHSFYRDKCYLCNLIEDEIRRTIPGILEVKCCPLCGPGDYGGHYGGHYVGYGFDADGDYFNGD
jgi:hypothetical protein